MSEIRQTPAIELMEHVRHIKSRESTEKLWAVRISAHPHADKEFQRSVCKDIEKIAETGEGKIRKSSFDLADSDETRSRMIGGEIRGCGDKWDEWVVRHPRHMKWLKAAGYSLDDAKQSFDEWWQDQMQDDDGEAVGVTETMRNEK